MGLAWGLNQLFFEMCTAPHVLILEEDWLYMDGDIAEQTPGRRAAIRMGIDVIESGGVAHDCRQIMGVFLRPETYETFLRPPFVGPWQRTASGVEHKPYCADTSGEFLPLSWLSVSFLPRVPAVFSFASPPFPPIHPTPVILLLCHSLC